jgi:hypothetical protein
MELKSGIRLRSAVCSTEVIVVRVSTEALTIQCGGYDMIPLDADPPTGLSLEQNHGNGALLGKRYGNAEIELLCTKGGDGALSVNGSPLPVKDAKPLPSSD